MKKPLIDMKLIKAAASRTAFSSAPPAIKQLIKPPAEKPNRERERSLNFRVHNSIFEDTRDAAATLRLTQVEFIEQAIQAHLVKVKEEVHRRGHEWVKARPPRNTRSKS